MEGDTLTFDPQCMLPVEFERETKGHNIIYVRSMFWHILTIFLYVTEVRHKWGVLVTGPPGSGKVSYLIPF